MMNHGSATIRKSKKQKRIPINRHIGLVLEQYNIINEY